ncbi:MAG: type II toxin-antitoxin system Phd/YefM family antitoxin [Desulfobacca sp.]|uniref:type II toxin-antitoxin system Phd/YefM family antitoxin n=1 Tax=Desulfobacca sp. TaxID=2067990 RepID=UPI00404AAAFC
MDSVVSATQARIHLGQLIRQVMAGEVVIIEHLGKPAVVMLPVQEYKRLKAHRQQDRKETLQKIFQLNAQLQARPGGTWLLTPPAEIMQEIRDERDATLNDVC